MAKYTREQRQRAVELYVKYECCAADVIRELGYPSREALRMWHRDWLDEQGTGVSSQRGERYARYTEEQKRAAVDHYLTHGRRASRTMRQMCVCSIESGPCERVDVFHVSGRFWSTSACGEKRTPARPAWTSFPS